MSLASEMTDALKGAMVALAASLLVALLFAYTFRIPIPMGGMIGPFGQFEPYGMAAGEVLNAVVVAWIFYGMFGGFIILAVCGAVTGLLVGRKYSNTREKNRMIVFWSIIVSALPVFALSTLDYIIGPW
jgi:hypothetical protein